MGTITLPNNPGTIQNAQVTDATKVMENFTAIVSEVNGSLSAANLAALAVTAAKLAVDAVETAKIKDGNVTVAKIPVGFGFINIFDGNAAAPAGVYNGSGDAKVQVKEAIDTMPTSGTLEIHGDEYAYTSLDTANKAFNLSGTLSRDYVEDDAVYVQTTIRNLKLSGIFDNLDRIKAGTDYGRNIIFDGNAALPAGAYNGTGDAIVRVKESIDNLPTSGVLEIAGDEYAYTSVTIADKEFNLSGTLSQDYAEDDAVYVQTVIRNVKITGNTTMSAVAVSQVQLKTSIGSVSEVGAGFSNKILPGGEYGFYPQVKMSTTGTGGFDVFILDNPPGFTGWTTYRTNVSLDNIGGGTLFVQQRYVTSSGEIFWVFILRDKVSKDIKSVWQAPDHPCFGNGGKPQLVPHPFPAYDNKKYEIITINPSKDLVKEIKAKCIVENESDPDKDFVEVLLEEYEIDETSNPAWPDVPVTVGLPLDWERLPIGSDIKPVKKNIPQTPGLIVKNLKVGKERF